MAAGKYVWLGMKVTGPNTLAWEDGTRYSYAKFLPPGNKMLKKKFVGAGIFVRKSYHMYVNDNLITYYIQTPTIRIYLNAP